MNRLILLLLLSLSSCGANPPTTPLGADLSALLTLYETDLTHAYSAAQTATPADNAGMACFGALIALNAALIAQAPTMPPVGAMSAIEGARLIMIHAQTDIFSLMVATVAGCNGYIADTKARGIAVAGEFTGLIAAVSSNLTAIVSTP